VLTLKNYRPALTNLQRDLLMSKPMLALQKKKNYDHWISSEANDNNDGQANKKAYLTINLKDYTSCCSKTQSGISGSCWGPCGQTSIRIPRDPTRILELADGSDDEPENGSPATPDNNHENPEVPEKPVESAEAELSS
jgi:hypothetical protein